MFFNCTKHDIYYIFEGIRHGIARVSQLTNPLTNLMDQTAKGAQPRVAHKKHGGKRLGLSSNNLSHNWFFGCGF